jgi:hypothetical protein
MHLNLNIKDNYHNGCFCACKLFYITITLTNKALFMASELELLEHLLIVLISHLVIKLVPQIKTRHASFDIFKS